MAYYFSSGSTQAEKQIKILRKVLDAGVNIAKLNVAAIICDMGTNNVSTLKKMYASVLEPYIIHEGRKIFTIFDPPHLLKCTASLFRKQTIDIAVNVASSENILKAKFADVTDAHCINQ